jgi:hypothetical protein
VHRNFSRKEMIRQKQFGYLDVFSEGITESEFMEEYEWIKEFYKKDLDLPEEKSTLHVMEILHDIYVSNPAINSWALPEKMSDNLKVFLKLQGESF